MTDYTTDFLAAMEFIEQQEGGWSDDPHDHGGLTRYGISQAAYPSESLVTLTRERARFLYWRDYWQRIGGDLLPWPLSLVAFDWAVHSGPRRTVRSLQRVLGVSADGDFGPKTVAALQAVDPQRAARDLLLARVDFLVFGMRSGTFSPDDPLRFLKGFWRRTIHLAFAMAQPPPTEVTIT